MEIASHRGWCMFGIFYPKGLWRPVHWRNKSSIILWDVKRLKMVNALPLCYCMMEYFCSTFLSLIEFATIFTSALHAPMHTSHLFYPSHSSPDIFLFCSQHKIMKLVIYFKVQMADPRHSKFNIERWSCIFW